MSMAIHVDGHGVKLDQARLHLQPATDPQWHIPTKSHPNMHEIDEVELRARWNACSCDLQSLACMMRGRDQQCHHRRERLRLLHAWLLQLHSDTDETRRQRDGEMRDGEIKASSTNTSSGRPSIGRGCPEFSRFWRAALGQHRPDLHPLGHQSVCSPIRHGCCQLSAWLLRMTTKFQQVCLARLLSLHAGPPQAQRDTSGTK